MSPISTCKLFAVVLFCTPQLAIAFVWEHTDDSRNIWRGLVANAFVKDCHNDPTEACLKTSSVMELTRKVCGKVPPGASVADHRDIYRDVCVNDAQTGVQNALAEIDKTRAESRRRANDQVLRERQDLEAKKQVREAEAERQRRAELARERKESEARERTLRSEIEKTKREEDRKREAEQRVKQANSDLERQRAESKAKADREMDRKKIEALLK